MIRLLVVLLVVVGLPALLYLAWTAIRPARPAAVIDKEIQTSARNNYLMLEEAIRILGRILDDDDQSLMVLRNQRKQEALTLVALYNQRQLG